MADRDRRRRQCAKCPWRVDVDPNDIPKGYSCDAHRNLANTVADSSSPLLVSGLQIMACHEFPTGKEQACVGWLHNQLGVGNNISLRLAVVQRQISANYELVGEQHETFEDTLPKEVRK